MSISSCLAAYLRGALLISAVVLVAGPVNGQSIDCLPQVIPVEGNSLAGLVFSGDELKMHPTGCRELQQEDLIVFRTSLSSKRYIKQLWGKPGDDLSVVEGNRLDINGSRVKTPDGRELRLNRLEVLKVSKLQGKLTGFFVVGVPDSLDSTDIGAIEGRFVLGSVPFASLKDNK